MTHLEELLTVALNDAPALEVEDIPELILPLLINLRNAWLNERTSSLDRNRDVVTVNLVIINLELMIENKSLKI